jgi:hypothetical protein
MLRLQPALIGITRTRRLKMDATDHFAGAFERHVEELAEVKDALKELAVDQSDPNVATQLEDLASRLEALAQDMGGRQGVQFSLRSPVQYFVGAGLRLRRVKS